MLNLRNLLLASAALSIAATGVCRMFGAERLATRRWQPGVR